MVLKQIRVIVSGLLFMCLLGQSCELHAWNLSRVPPKIYAIGRRIVHSRYFVPFAALATILISGYAGYKLSPARHYNVDGHLPVPLPVRPHALPRLNGVDDPEPQLAHPHPVQAARRSIRNQAQQRAVVRARRGFFDRFTDEDYLRQEQIQLGENRDVPGRGIFVHNIRNNGQICVQQALVRNQRGASCGYHALKNACGIASTLLGNDRRPWLSSPEMVNQLFGAEGQWRLRIQRERQKRVLRYYIEHLMPVNDMVEDNAGQFNLENIRGLYMALHREYVAEVVGRLFAGEDSIEITPDVFVDWVRAQDVHIDDPLRYGKNVTVEAIREHIHNRETILAYIDISRNQVLRCSRAMLTAALERYNDVAYDTEKFNTTTLNGEWLDDGEVEQLITHIKNEQEHLNQIPIIALNSITSNVLELNEDVTQLRDAIRAGNELPHRVYAFILGDMKYDKNGTGRAGHWMTLVLDTLEPTQRRYTLADSSGNMIRMYSGPCQAFIRYLEGDAVAQRLVLPNDHREPGMLGLVAHKWRQLWL